EAAVCWLPTAGCVEIVTAMGWATFQRYPEGFHSCASGCVCPAVFVARAMSVYSPSAAVQSCCHRRHPYFVCWPPSLAALQVFPPSVETSTLLTGEAFDQAAPWMRSFPGFAQLSGLAITEFTLRSVTGTMSLGSTAVPGATGLGGWR